MIRVNYLNTEGNTDINIDEIRRVITQPTSDAKGEYTAILVKVYTERDPDRVAVKEARDDVVRMIREARYARNAALSRN